MKKFQKLSKHPVRGTIVGILDLGGLNHFKNCIDAKKTRDVMIANNPNIFVQTEIDEKESSNQSIMSIKRASNDMLVNISTVIDVGQKCSM